VLYKRIASARDDADLRALQVEMIDRFGLLPPASKNLFAITELKLQAERLRVRKIEVGPSGGHILFKPQPAIDPVKVILLIQQPSQTYRLDGPEKLRFTQAFEHPQAKIDFLGTLLQQLAEDSA